MKAVIQGTFLGMSSFHSEKKNKDIPQAILYDGEKDNITVDDVPAGYADKVKFGDQVELPVKIYSGQYGLRVSYDSPAAK
jgi:hypothetical protein